MMRLPQTISTAIVSPIVRLRANTIAAIIPGADCRSTTCFTVCQRVAPSAVEASRRLLAYVGEELHEKRDEQRQNHHAKDDATRQHGVATTLLCLRKEQQYVKSTVQ